jgi:HEAT repeat protein
MRGGGGDAILQGLRDPAEEVRIEVAESLMYGREEKAIPLLIDALQDRSWRVRQQATKTLKARKAKEAIPALLVLLEDPRREVRDEAALALGTLGAKEAKAPLIRALRVGDHHERAWAAEALGMLGEKDAVPALCVILEDEEEAVRYEAVLALERLRSREAIVPLMAMYLRGEREESLRGAILSALLECEAVEAIPIWQVALRDEASWVRRRAVRALGDIVERAEEGDPLREVEAIGYAGSSSIREQIDLAALERLLDDPMAEVRATTARALGKLGAREAAEALLERLEDEDGVVRASAAWALGKLGERRVGERLCVLALDEYWDARSSAALALGRLGGAETQEVLMGMLLDGQPEIRENAALSLGCLQALPLVGVPFWLEKLRGICAIWEQAEGIHADVVGDWIRSAEGLYAQLGVLCASALDAERMESEASLAHRHMWSSWPLWEDALSSGVSEVVERLQLLRVRWASSALPAQQRAAVWTERAESLLVEIRLLFTQERLQRIAERAEDAFF